MPFSQATRRIAIETPLGPDVLVLTGIDGVEEISRLSCFHVRMLSERDSITAAEIVGKNVTAVMRDDDDTPHFINGYVRTFVNQGTGDRGTVYRAEVVPWLWFLTRRTDCRIFQEKSVPQIVEEVFREAGFTDFEFNVGSYGKRTYCVQYRESDYDFVARLLEQEGIFYYFRHTNGKHVLVLGDKAAAYTQASDAGVRYVSRASYDDTSSDITSWEHRYEFRSGRVMLHDFNFETPQESIASRGRTLLPISGNQRCELYDYPGDYLERGGGEQRALVRMQEEEAAFDTVYGAGKCRSFRPGHVFTIREHTHAHERNARYVVTRVEHHADSSTFVAGADVAEETYRNEFICIPATVVFRPARITPRSYVRGPQTAVVVGPAGDEIYTDKYGRAKVQFHWDRCGTKNDRSSCWLRVSQSWAGKEFGGVAIPRIGHEVIVDFLEGDPDRPIITGRVYNSDQTAPQTLPEPEVTLPKGKKPIAAMQGRAQELPACKTRTTFKTNSSPGGGAGNEMCFDDDAGKELFFLNCVKDAVSTVGNDQTTTIGNNCEIYVCNDLLECIGRNHDLKIGSNQEAVIGANQTVKIGGNREEEIKGNQKITIKGKDELIITMNQLTDVGTDIERKAKVSIKDSSAQIEISATAQLKLVCGGSSITLTPALIQIQAPLVKIN